MKHLLLENYYIVDYYYRQPITGKGTYGGSVMGVAN